MNQIVLKTDINKCELLNWQANSGEVNARVLKVEMCEEMCACAMAFVTFELADGTVHESKIVDGKAKIPLIKDPQFVKIGVYSADVEGDKCEKRYSPTPTHAYINMGSYKDGSSESPKPTPGDYAELLEQIAGVKKDTAESLADLEKGTIKIITEQVNLWELETGIYYLDGGFKYKTDLEVSGGTRHIFLIYKPVSSKKTVRYIHFCGDYKADTWSSIECGYTNGTTHTEYKIIDSSKTTFSIEDDTDELAIPYVKAVKNYVKDYVNEQLGVIDNGRY